MLTHHHNLADMTGRILYTSSTVKRPQSQLCRPCQYERHSIKEEQWSKIVAMCNPVVGIGYIRVSVLYYHTMLRRYRSPGAGLAKK
jgi:hypothetical protein